MKHVSKHNDSLRKLDYAREKDVWARPGEQDSNWVSFKDIKRFFPHHYGGSAWKTV